MSEADTRSTPDAADELAQLRRRAYGPDADIQRDPDAVRRLHELEGRSRTAGAVPPDDEAPAEADSFGPLGELVAADQTDPARARRGRRTLSFVASLALVGAVAALVGWTIPHAVAPAADSTLRTVAVADAEAARSAMMRTFDWLELDTPVVYESYDDLQVMSAASPDGLTCLLVFWPDHWSDFSCTPDDLTPVVDYDAYLGAPILLDDPLPPGTVIRFELRGDAVSVTLREPPKGMVSAGQRDSGRVTSANDSRPSAA